MHQVYDLAIKKFDRQERRSRLFSSSGLTKKPGCPTRFRSGTYFPKDRFDIRKQTVLPPFCSVASLPGISMASNSEAINRLMLFYLIKLITSKCELHRKL